MPIKRHIEYGRHLEFLRKKTTYKANKKNLIKKRFVGFRSKSNFGGYLELSSHLEFSGHF
jgi:hypothetical protein